MLTDRQKAILQILVDDYIRSAEPVGSRTLSKRSDLTISPATIRNEMADLEELGYLEQPHTSAGRVPSQKGYRFYVDHLLKPLAASSDDVDSLRRGFVNKMDQMEQVVQQTATILSSLTNYTSIVLGPQMFTTTLRHITLVPLQDRSAVAIIVADNGHVENRKVSVPEGIPVEMIQRFVEVLNRKLTGVPLHKLKQQLHTEVARELNRYSEQFDGMMMLLNEMLTPQEDQASRVYLGGTTMILNQPEFRDVDKLKPLLNMFEQTDDLLQALGDPSNGSGIIVRIGQENALETIHECSLITASYAIDGQPVGTIGVLGPTRMDYGRVIAVMEYLSGNLSGLLTRLNK
ncbi:MAG: heat-inducible transcriptional repressor HrcA [Tumebacillaceae bacterium]